MLQSSLEISQLVASRRKFYLHYYKADIKIGTYSDSTLPVLKDCYVSRDSDETDLVVEGNLLVLNTVSHSLMVAMLNNMGTMSEPAINRKRNCSKLLVIC